MSDLLPVDDPFAPDAPLHHLLAIQYNPLVADMSDEELIKLVRRCREYATSQPTLSSKLLVDAQNVDPVKRKSNAVAAKRKALLAEL